MRWVWMLLGLLAVPSLAVSAWGAPRAAGCGVAIAAAERAVGTAPGLLAAIGLVESGRADPRTGVRAPWPWTVTAEGVGTFYGSEAAAAGAVEGLRARGVRSIDVGCMQVNLLQHPGAFRDLAQAFEPGANAMYAARFLAGLHGRLGDWMAAAAAYHSMTPAVGARYGRLVAAVWAGAPVPVVQRGDGVQVVRFADGGQMRIMRDATVPGGRVMGYLTGP